MRLSLLLTSLAVAATATHAMVLPGLDSAFGALPESTELITQCGDESDTLKIDYINISPDPPKKGEVLDIDARGTLFNRVDNGTVIELQVKAGLIKLVQQKLDFCEESTKIDKPCPLEPGVHVLKHQVQLPKEIPPALYTVHVVVIDQDKSQVTCLNAKADFRLHRGRLF